MCVGLPDTLPLSFGLSEGDYELSYKTFMLVVCRKTFGREEKRPGAGLALATRRPGASRNLSNPSDPIDPSFPATTILGNKCALAL